jgi:hypothetical protein
MTDIETVNEIPMPPPGTKWTTQKLGDVLRMHVQGDRSRDQKTNALYQAVVTGNGEPPIKQTVHDHSTWIGGANRIIWMLVTAIVGQVVILGCTASYLVIKIYPLLQNIDALEKLK